MEKEVKIKTSDKKFISGTLSMVKKKSNSLIIFVHGFTGHPNEHIFFNGTIYFNGKGIDTFRFSLYAGGKGTRNFRDTKISIHGQDITTVVKYFRKQYKKIFVVGHSYGGTSLLFVDQSIVDKFIFWDASYISHLDAKQDMKFNKNLDAYIMNWGIEYIVGKEFVEQLKNFPDCKKLIQNIHKPVLFVGAGGKGNLKASKKYFSFANEPKKLVSIEKADHCFNTWNDEQELFRETYRWLK